MTRQSTSELPPCRAAALGGILVLATASLAQEPADDVSGLAFRYIQCVDGGGQSIDITPDLVADGLLGAGAQLVEILNMARLRAIKNATRLDLDLEGRPEANERVYWQGIAGPKFTPVWGQRETASDLEAYMAFRVSRGLDAEASACVPLSEHGEALWGTARGIIGGYSPLKGGLSDEETDMRTISDPRIASQCGIMGRLACLLASLEQNGSDAVLLAGWLRRGVADPGGKSRGRYGSPRIPAAARGFSGKGVDWDACEALRADLRAHYVALLRGQYAPLFTRSENAQMIDMARWLYRLEAAIKVGRAGAERGQSVDHEWSDVSCLFSPEVSGLEVLSPGVMAVEERELNGAMRYSLRMCPKREK